MLVSGIYFDETEIVPEVKGTFRFNRNNEMVTNFFYVVLFAIQLTYYVHAQ